MLHRLYRINRLHRLCHYKIVGSLVATDFMEYQMFYSDDSESLGKWGNLFNYQVQHKLSDLFCLDLMTFIYLNTYYTLQYTSVRRGTSDSFLVCPFHCYPIWMIIVIFQIVNAYKKYRIINKIIFRNEQQTNFSKVQ